MVSLRLRQALPWLGLLALLIAMQPLYDLLEYRHGSIADGAYWRLLTGHFIHAGQLHFLTSALAGALLLLLFRTVLTGMPLLFVTLTQALCISLYLYYRVPELEWYSGLSGLLHGLLVTGSLLSLAAGEWIFVLGLLLPWLKVGLETYYAPTGYISSVLGERVITQAHLAGVMTGTLTGCVLVAWQGLAGAYRKRSS